MSCGKKSRLWTSHLYSLSPSIIPGNPWWNYYYTLARILLWSRSWHYSRAIQGDSGLYSINFVRYMVDRASQKKFLSCGCWPSECRSASFTIVWHKNYFLLSLSWQTTIREAKFYKKNIPFFHWSGGGTVTTLRSQDLCQQSVYSGGV